MTWNRLGATITSAALAAVLVTGLSGCGSKEAPKASSGPGHAEEPKTPEGPPPTPAPEKVSFGLASGKGFVASSALAPYPGNGTIGSLPPGTNFFFHTKEEEGPWVQIDLSQPTKVSGVDVQNRTDCCGDRAVPLVVEVSSDGQSWTEVARKSEPFEVWNVTFEPKDLRYVRLRAPRKTYLHLRRVGIH